MDRTLGEYRRTSINEKGTRQKELQTVIEKDWTILRRLS